MRQEDIAPTITTDPLAERTIRDHPAFGRVVVSRCSGQYNTLFRSDLQHQHTVRVRVDRAYLVDTPGHSSMMARQGIVELIFTETQWAQMVASQGWGEGTPCTLLYAPAPGTKMETMPGIIADTLQDRHSKEFQDVCKIKMEKLDKYIDHMEAMLDKKTISTALLRSKLEGLRGEVARIPMDLAFMVTLFNEVVEEMTAEAETNINGYFQKLITDAGKQAYLEGRVELNTLPPEAEDE